MNILNNKRAGMAFCAACAVLALTLGPVNTVRRAAAPAREMFYRGEEGDGIGVNSDLERLADCAANLAVIGEKYDEAEKLAAEAKKAAQAVREAEKPAKKAKAAQKAGEAFEKLDKKLGEAALTDKDAEYRAGLQASVKGVRDTLRRDGYNELAAKYNRMIRQFPASLAQLLVTGGELPVFE